MVEPRLAQARMAGLSWSGKGHYRFLFGSVGGRRADHHGSLRICHSVEEIVVDSSPIYGGRAKIVVGSVGICNGREIIAGVETVPLNGSET